MSLYIIKNTSKAVHTRTVRAMTVGRVGSVQRVCGGRVRLGRGDSITISGEQFRTFYDELLSLQGRGLIEVRKGGVRGPVVAFNDARPTVVPTSEGVVESEPTPEEPMDATEVDVEVEEPEVKASPVEPEKPLDRMNKSELVEYAAMVLGEKSEELELLTKKQILERLS